MASNYFTTHVHIRHKERRRLTERTSFPDERPIFRTLNNRCLIAAVNTTQVGSPEGLISDPTDPQFDTEGFGTPQVLSYTFTHVPTQQFEVVNSEQIRVLRPGPLNITLQIGLRAGPNPDGSIQRFGVNTRLFRIRDGVTDLVFANRGGYLRNVNQRSSLMHYNNYDAAAGDIIFFDVGALNSFGNDRLAFGPESFLSIIY